MPRPPIRLRLSSGTELRVVRWLGRIVALGSLWPINYALGRSTLDPDALAFGVPALVVGLALWWWAGVRLRNPTSALELDHGVDEARLIRGGVVTAICRLGELQPWSRRTWRTTSTNKGVRTVTTWYAVRSPGFGEQDLFFDTRAERCDAWQTRVDLAVRAPEAIEPEEPLARRIDGYLAGAAGLPARVGLGLLTAGWLAAAAPLVLGSSSSRELIFAPSLAVVGLVLALAWRALGLPLASGLVATAMGLSLASKPWLAPITSNFDGTPRPMSVTSETHLYFLIPGLTLVGVGLLLTLRRPTVPGPPRRSPGAKAPPMPPRPKPPGASP